MPANILARAAGKLSFSHLTGASKKSEDKDDDKEKLEAEDDKEEQDRDDGDAKSSASQEDDKEEDEDKDQKSGKKSKKAKDDGDDDEKAEDDDDEEMRGKNALAEARRRERARCAAILGSPAAARNIELACSLAFETALPRDEAIAVLSKSGGKASTRHADRASRNPSIGPDGKLEAHSQQAVAASWDAAIKKVLPKPRD